MTTAADRARHALGTIQMGVDDLNRALGDLDSMTVEDKATTLQVLRDLFGPQRQCEAGLERGIAHDFRDAGWDLQHELPGIGMVEVRRSKDRKAWQHDRVQSDWLNAITVDGEYLDPAQVRDAFLSVASISGYKVTGLRELGLDPDDYCDSTPGAPRVVIA